MVVKMMRWRPWPPLVTKKYEVKLVIKRLEGFDPVRECAEQGGNGLTVEIKWKGPKMALSSLRRTAVKTNYTKEMEGVDPESDGVIQWDEEFHNVCILSAYKGNVFYPWEITFSVFNVSLIFNSLDFSLSFAWIFSGFWGFCDRFLLVC